MAVDYGSLPFAEAIEFFRHKLNLPTQRWDDLLGAAHDRAFVVAGAMQADLLVDLNAAVEQAIAEGTTIQTFRKDFEKIVAERGWTGWTGEGTKAGEAWRTRVIYDTNLFTSYSAGRTRQMKEVANLRPYWRYRHSPASVVPRAEHLAWDGVILRHDDPWWSTHTPSNGFGCKCYVETLAERDMKKQGLTVTDKKDIPFNGKDPKTGLPLGIDKGWDYQPGASVADDLARLEKMKEDKLKRLGLSGDAETMPAFIRSSTVQQAEQEALKLGVKSVDYRQSLDIANIVNDALDVMVQRGIAPPDHLKTDDRIFIKWATALGVSLQDLPAAFTFNRRTGKTWIYLNPQAPYWADPVREAQQQHQAGRWSSDHPNHAIWHELGHLMFFRHASTIHWMNPPLSLLEMSIAAQIGRQAKESVREFMAETFAALLAGRSLPADVLRLYRQYGGVTP